MFTHMLNEFHGILKYITNDVYPFKHLTNRMVFMLEAHLLCRRGSFESHVNDVEVYLNKTVGVKLKESFLFVFLL